MPIEFFDDEPLLDSDAFGFTVPSNLESADAIFTAYGDGLVAPNSYFASNWDAFNDSLLDLSWISCREVVIVHYSLPKLIDRELKIYLEILHQACLDWADEKTDQLAEKFDDFVPHSLKVLFSLDCKSTVRSFVN